MHKPNTFISYYEAREISKKMLSLKSVTQIITIKSIVLPPRDLRLGTETSDRQW